MDGTGASVASLPLAQDLGVTGWDTLRVVGYGAALLHDLLEFPASAVETDLDGEEGHAQKLRDLGGS